MTWEAAVTIAMIGLVFGLLAFTRVAPDLIFLGAVTLLLTFQVITPREAFSGARVIRAFVQEDREIARFRRENERTFGEHLRISQLIAAQVPVVSFLTALGLVAVLWQGGRLVTAGSLTAGGLVSFFVYAGLAVEPAIALSRFYASVRQGLAALERVLELTATSGDVRDAPQRRSPRVPRVRRPRGARGRSGRDSPEARGSGRCRVRPRGGPRLPGNAGGTP